VDDAEERLAELLRVGVLAEAADVVAEVLFPGGLDAREDPHEAPFVRFAAETNLRCAPDRHDASTRSRARRRCVGRGRASLSSSRFGAERQNGPDTLAAWQSSS